MMMMMMRDLLVGYFTAILIYSVYGTKNSDKIDYIPTAWPQPTFKQYSGYLNGATLNIKLHYWLVEAAVSPSKVPLVLWLNGGPGCSSMEGLFSENGPYNVVDGPRLKKNPYSWNNIANMLYIESPAGVGYSYAVDGNLTVDDDLTSLHNFHALLNFMERFPEYNGREFFITGESYGGVYIPTLALRVVKSNLFNFKGIAVGNGLTNYQMNDNSLLYFVNYHGLINEKQWEELLTQCCDQKLKTKCIFTSGKSTGCQSLVSYILKVALKGLNIYNLYSPCAGGSNQSSAFLLSNNPETGNRFTYVHNDLGNLFRTNVYQKHERSVATTLRHKYNTKLVIPCVDDYNIRTYLNSPYVRQFIHVNPNITTWEVCSDIVNRDYKRNYFDLTDQYTEVLKSKIPILIYNGDVDMACNYFGDEWFIDNLNLTLIRPLSSWLYQDKDETFQVAGYWKMFKRNDTPLVFTTIRGSGHMVPTDKPIVALSLFKKFISRMEFP